MDFMIDVAERFWRNLAKGMEVEGFRYLLAAGSVFLITWVMLKGVLVARRIRKALPPRLRNIQILREIRNSGLTIVVFVFANALVNEMLEGVFGGPVYKIYQDVDTYGWAYLAFSVLLWSMALETWFYWTHRFMHHRWFYKVFHLEHHRSHKTTPFTAYSFAPPEAVLVFLFVPIFFCLVPMHDIAFVSAMMIQIFRNAIAHCGYEIFPRGWARHPVLGLFATVTHHDMHHEKGTGNFGFYFTIWDRLMGTEHPDYLERFDRVTSGAPKAAASLA